MTAADLDLLARACRYVVCGEHAAAIISNHRVLLEKARSLIQQGVDIETSAAVGLSLALAMAV